MFYHTCIHYEVYNNPEKIGALYIPVYMNMIPITKYEMWIVILLYKRARLLNVPIQYFWFLRSIQIF